MKNKKFIITVLLAAITAFVLAVLICKTPHKPVKLEKPQKENPEERIEDTSGVQLPQNKEQEKIEPVKIKPSVKPIKRPAALPKEPQASVKKEETVLQEPVTGSAEQIQEIKADVSEPEGVVVPVEYKSKSVYKYVYTPVRYNKN